MVTLRVDHDIELRLLQEEDAEAEWSLWHENSDMYLQWFPGNKGDKTLAKTREWIEANHASYVDNKGFAVGIWFKGRLAGVIDLHWVDWTNRVGEIAYWLGTAYRGQGLMTRACRALVDHAFNVMGLNRVTIRCAKENAKSRAVPERLGFTQEGVIRQGGRLHDRYVDNVIYGMLADEWGEGRA